MNFDFGTQSPHRRSLVLFRRATIFLILFVSICQTSEIFAQQKLPSNKELDRVLEQAAPKSIRELRLLEKQATENVRRVICLLYTSPSPRD